MYEPDCLVAILLPDGDKVLAYRGVTVSVSAADVEVVIVTEVNDNAFGIQIADPDATSPAPNAKPDWYRRLKSGLASLPDTPELGRVENVPYRMNTILMTFPLNREGESGNLIPWTADVAEQFRESAQSGAGGIILRLTKHWPPPEIATRPSTERQGFGHGA